GQGRSPEGRQRMQRKVEQPVQPQGKIERPGPRGRVSPSEPPGQGRSPEGRQRMQRKVEQPVQP
ncbi:MAG TPA: hypothetical protein PK125_02745, partial [Syntrophorhabdus sp.]|nr:hypothetical protein [Syntrophorhabdus sp.]HPW35025.1 hypothetical protein [Syntrophorhabdus sp.]